MKKISVILLTLIFLSLNAAEEKKVMAVPNFKPVSDLQQSMDQIQLSRLAKRRDFINDLTSKIDSELNQGDRKKAALDLPVLGDECLNLFAVSDLPEKKVKKIKKMGTKIDDKCDSLQKKLDSGKPEVLIEKFSDIKKMIQELFQLCNAGE